MFCTKHFDSNEFTRWGRPGKPGFEKDVPYPTEWISLRLVPLCRQLEVIRDALGERHIHINSGYRDPNYNALIGGARLSQHMAGRAADITIADVEPQQVHDTILELYIKKAIVIGGLGYYAAGEHGNGFVHVDIRDCEFSLVGGGSTVVVGRTLKKLARWTGSRAEN
jgi:hypothetical protein